MKKTMILAIMLLMTSLTGCITDDNSITVEYYDTISELRSNLPEKYVERRGLLMYDLYNDFPSWMMQKQYGIKDAYGVISVIILYEFAREDDLAIHYIGIELSEIEPDRILTGITNKHHFNRNSFEVKFNPIGGKQFVQQMDAMILEGYRGQEGEQFDMHCYLYYLDRQEVARIMYFTETDQQDLALNVFAPVSAMLEKNIAYLTR